MTDDRWSQREQSADDDPLLDPRAAASMTPPRDTDAMWGAAEAPAPVHRRRSPRDEGREPEPEPTLRVWSALLAPFVALFVAFVATLIVLFAIGFVIGVQASTAGRSMPTDEQIFREHPWVFLLLALPAPVVFLCVPLAATVRSSVPLEERLALTPGAMPPWTWGVFMAASPFIGWLGGFMVEDSAEYQLMTERIRAIVETGPLGFAMTVLIIAVGAGISEELLFRGYVQSRLLQRWPAVLAIVVSAALFALAHVHPAHMLGVFPLGIWLGVVAWRTRSVYPAMLCHGLNNLFAIIAVTWLEPYEQDASGPGVGLLVITIIAFCWSIVLLTRGGQGTAHVEPSASAANTDEHR